MNSVKLGKITCTLYVHVHVRACTNSYNEGELSVETNTSYTLLGIHF